jgi:hypothetical protein
MTIEHVSKFRADADEKGFITIRTGERNDSPDSDLIASVWNGDFLPLLLNAPSLLVELIALRTRFHNACRGSGSDEEYVVGSTPGADAAIARATGAQS